MLKLNLGCGSVVRPGWHNLDISPAPGVIHCDLTKKLPYTSMSVDCVSSEHFIEHVPRETLRFILQECKRVLKPDGLIRLSTPDLRALIKAYYEDDVKAYAAVGWLPDTPCQMMNGGMRLWGHEFLYDERELTALMRDVGFKMVTRQLPGVSHWKAMAGLETRPNCGDLCVEGMA